jgi:hypothetical protein
MPKGIDNNKQRIEIWLEKSTLQKIQKHLVAAGQSRKAWIEVSIETTVSRQTKNVVEMKLRS